MEGGGTLKRHLYTGVPTSRDTDDTLTPARSAPHAIRTPDVIRRAPRPRNSPPKQRAVHTNRLLSQLPLADRDALLTGAEYVSLRVGQTFARAGDPISKAF